MLFTILSLVSTAPSNIQADGVASILHRKQHIHHTGIVINIYAIYFDGEI
jgi:hypothetical protein